MSSVREEHRHANRKSWKEGRGLAEEILVFENGNASHSMGKMAGAWTRAAARSHWNARTGDYLKEKPLRDRKIPDATQQGHDERRACPLCKRSRKKGRWLRPNNVERAQGLYPSKGGGLKNVTPDYPTGERWEKNMGNLQTSY